MEKTKMNVIAAPVGQTALAKMEDGTFMDVPIIAWCLAQNAKEPFPVFAPLQGRVIKHWRLMTDRGVFLPQNKPGFTWGGIEDAVRWMEKLK
jgi:hypothetical protein